MISRVSLLMRRWLLEGCLYFLPHYISITNSHRISLLSCFSILTLRRLHVVITMLYSLHSLLPPTAPRCQLQLLVLFDSSFPFSTGTLLLLLHDMRLFFSLPFITSSLRQFTPSSFKIHTTFLLISLHNFFQYMILSLHALLDSLISF